MNVITGGWGITPRYIKLRFAVVTLTVSYDFQCFSVTVVVGTSLYSHHPTTLSIQYYLYYDIYTLNLLSETVLLTDSSRFGIFKLFVSHS
jgi:hypothetical protein